MNDYIDKSGKAMLAAGLAYDNARSAEKMAQWEYVGDTNKAWKEGPYLSSPANKKKMDRSHPYCIKTSEEFGMIFRIVLGSNPPQKENGGVRIPLPPENDNNSRVEPVIAKLAIIEQFELFKEFLTNFDGPFNKKRCKDWRGKIDDESLDLIIKMIERRNELTHDSDCLLPSMKEAAGYFYHLKQLAMKLYEVTKISTYS